MQVKSTAAPAGDHAVMRKIALEHIPVNRELHAFPRVVIVEIVAGCNLACIMCPEKAMTRPRGIMDLALFRRIAAQVAAADPATELWAPIMGEVFLYRDRVFDYLDAAREAGLTNVNLNTNLVLFRPEWIGRLARSRLARIVVGLDAATQETYRRIRVDANPRRKGNHARVEANIAALLEAKAAGRLPDLEVVLQFIVQEENAHEEEAFRRRWEGSGAALKIRHKLGWGTAVRADALDLASTERVIPCPWLMRTMSIHWTGQVAQCDAMWSGDEYLGDLRCETIGEVWQGELLRRRLRHLASDFDFDPCRDCGDWQCGRSESVAAAAPAP
jgi:MoaA/NifB/PqqE/SkfB family radical SAM enzyme